MLLADQLAAAGAVDPGAQRGLLLAAVMVLFNPVGAPRFDPGLLLAAVGFAAAVLLLEEGLALRQVLRLESGPAGATQ